ncbi:hypothetical protein ACFX2I_020208 [Malus domestica]
MEIKRKKQIQEQEEEEERRRVKALEVEEELSRNQQVRNSKDGSEVDDWGTMYNKAPAEIRVLLTGCCGGVVIHGRCGGVVIRVDIRVDLLEPFSTETLGRLNTIPNNFRSTDYYCLSHLAQKL